MNWAPPRVGTRLMWALIALALCAALGAAQSRDERAVRAAYVFNLTKYVEWPAGKNELVIGFVGSPETGEVMQKMLDGKRSESRIIHVLLFRTAVPVGRGTEEMQPGLHRRLPEEDTPPAG